jgi:hypothetical protein
MIFAHGNRGHAEKLGGAALVSVILRSIRCQNFSISANGGYASAD